MLPNRERRRVCFRVVGCGEPVYWERPDWRSRSFGSCTSRDFAYRGCWKGEGEGETVSKLVVAACVILALYFSWRLARRVYRPLVRWGADHHVDSKLVALFLPICLLGLLGAIFSWSWFGMISLGLLILYGAVAGSAFFLPIPTEPREDTFGHVHETRKVENRGAPLTHDTPPQAVERAALPARDASGYDRQAREPVFTTYFIQDMTVERCPACGIQNRVPVHGDDVRPKCGRCGVRLLDRQAQENPGVPDAAAEVRRSRSTAAAIVLAHEFKTDTESMTGADISADRDREIPQVGRTAGAATAYHSSHPIAVKDVGSMDQATKDYWLPLKNRYEDANERYEDLRGKRDRLREWAEKQFTPRPDTDGDIGLGAALLVGALVVVPALLFGEQDSSEAEQAPPLSLAALIPELEEHPYVESGYKTREILARAPDIPREEILRAIQARIGNLEREMARLAEEIDQMEATLDNWPCREPPHWEKRRKQVIDSAKDRCEKCGREAQWDWGRDFRRYNPDFHVHHIHPLSQGGTHALDNLRLLCIFCHGHEADLGHEKIRADIGANMRAWHQRFGKYPISVLDLLSAGYLEHGCKIYGHVGEQRATATILRQGLIEFEGTEYESLGISCERSRNDGSKASEKDRQEGQDSPHTKPKGYDTEAS